MNQRMSSLALGIAGLVIGASAQHAYDARKSSDSQSSATALSAIASSQPVAAAGSASAAPAPPWAVDPFDRSKIDYSKMPLWAWGDTEPPKLDDKQGVQGAPGMPVANPNASLPPEEVQRKRHADGSKIEMSLLEIRARNPGGGGNVIDWFPEEHPNPMPAIITRGPAALGKNTRACGTCHLADGAGRPENASPAGLPAAYIVRQLKDFRDGLRHNADQRKANSNTMVMLAKAMTDDEMQQSATYWAAVKYQPHVRVIETRLVPKTKIQGELFIPQAKERTEPIGNRIIEVPADVEQSQVLRSTHGEWIAYVPMGSIKKGENLVTTGGSKVVNGEVVAGKTLACGACHGKDLMGVAPDVPPLASRSPSYIAREIFDIQQRARVGSNPNVEVMRAAIKELTADDILNIAAYLGSLPVAKAPGNQIAQR